MTFFVYLQEEIRCPWDDICGYDDDENKGDCKSPVMALISLQIMAIRYLI